MNICCSRYLYFNTSLVVIPLTSHISPSAITFGFVSLSSELYFRNRK